MLTATLLGNVSKFIHGNRHREHPICLRIQTYTSHPSLATVNMPPLQGGVLWAYYRLQTYCPDGTIECTLSHRDRTFVEKNKKTNSVPAGRHVNATSFGNENRFISRESRPVSLKICLCIQHTPHKVVQGWLWQAIDASLGITIMKNVPAVIRHFERFQHVNIFISEGFFLMHHLLIHHVVINIVQMTTTVRERAKTGLPSEFTTHEAAAIDPLWGLALDNLYCFRTRHWRI